MSTTIKCTKCGEIIEVTAALQGQIEDQILQAEHKKHLAELERVRTESTELLQKKLEGERELLKRAAEADLEIARKQLEAEALNSLKKNTAEQELMLKTLQEDATSAKEESKKLREQLTELTKSLREERQAKENAELEMQKKLSQEEGKIREEAGKLADERYRLIIAEQDKKIADTQRALEDAQRKASQGSQQLQGEIMELDLERTMAEAFRDDEISPIAKGSRGGDIRQIVKSPRGTVCGVILWEIKRTKNWTDGWIPKLKEDMRAEKANIPVIVTEVMPKELSQEMGLLNGVWICKSHLAIVLGTLLRKSLLDVGLQKALAENKGTKAEALYTFITSHEFVQQVESILETYREMSDQIAKEKVSFQKIWAQREAQNQRLIGGTANIIGSMQGYIGQAAMPRIKGLELLEAGE